MKFLFLIPLFPLLGFLFNFIVGVRVLRRARATTATATAHGHGARRARAAARPSSASSPAARCCCRSWSSLNAVLAAHARARPHAGRDAVDLDPGRRRRDRGGRRRRFTVDWAYQVDPLSSVMLLVVTFVGFFIHVYSTGT